MKLYIKQHVFTFGDKFSIYDESGNERYYVEGEVFTFGKKLHLYSLEGRELAYIEQKLFSFLPKYHIYINGNEIAEVVKEFAFFHNEYSVNGLGWRVDGNFLDHDYTVESEGRLIASVAKEWFTWGDAYEISIIDGIDPIPALAVVLVIDACIEAENNN
ncbi:MAG: LURP-one-related family protein [Clostridia bacterium]|nr:LURP-one-related family protein [Clostridia bacterium]